MAQSIPGRFSTTHWLAQLSGVVMVAAALLAFAGVAGEMLEGETIGFDRAILLALRNPVDPNDPIGPHWLTELARDVTGLGGTAILTFITLATAGYLALVRRWADGLLVLIAVGCRATWNHPPWRHEFAPL